MSDNLTSRELLFILGEESESTLKNDGVSEDRLRYLVERREEIVAKVN